jgi:hypothetical protein
MKILKQRKISFIVVWMILIFAARVSAQTRSLAGEKLLPAGFECKTAKPRTDLVQNTWISESYPAFFKAMYTPQKMPGADYYMQHIGFLCKKEWELEKTAHLPLRFRLGSLEYCDFMEGRNKGYPPE